MSRLSVKYVLVALMCCVSIALLLVPLLDEGRCIDALDSISNLFIYLFFFSF